MSNPDQADGKYTAPQEEQKLTGAPPALTATCFRVAAPQDMHFFPRPGVLSGPDPNQPLTPQPLQCKT